MAGVDVVPLQEVAGAITSFCYRALESKGYAVRDENVSIEKVVEVVQFASRDLDRISHDLSDKVSREKFAAYHAFWLSKLKPVSAIKRQDQSSEIVDINERLAVWLAVEWVTTGATSEGSDDKLKYTAEEARSVGFTEPPAPLVWRTCRKRCGGVCFKSGARNYLKFHDDQNFEYLVHSLRHRAVGPYSLVNFLEAVIITSCEDIRQCGI